MDMSAIGGATMIASRATITQGEMDDRSGWSGSGAHSEAWLDESGLAAFSGRFSGMGIAAPARRPSTNRTPGHPIVPHQVSEVTPQGPKQARSADLNAPGR